MTKQTTDMVQGEIEAFVGNDWEAKLSDLSKVQTSILILLLANGEALVAHLFGDLQKKLEPLTDQERHTKKDGQNVFGLIQSITAFGHEQICKEIDRRFPVA